MSANSVKKLLTRLTAVLATTAAGADMVVIQEQVNTTNTAEFDYLYSNSRAEAQAANPAVLTDAEVSTGYGTAGQMATAAKSAHADGIYINATTPTLAKPNPSSTPCKPPATNPRPARKAWCPRSNVLRGHQALLRAEHRPRRGH